MASIQQRAEALIKDNTERQRKLSEQLTLIDSKKKQAKAQGESFYLSDFDAHYPGFRIIDIETGATLGAALGSTIETATNNIEATVVAVKAEVAAAAAEPVAKQTDLAKQNADAFKKALAALNPTPTTAAKKDSAK